MKIKCAYPLCQKEIEEEKAVISELTFTHGHQKKTEPRKYCSERCASHDQMANES